MKPAHLVGQRTLTVLLAIVSAALLMYPHFGAANKYAASTVRPKAVGSLMPSFIVRDEKGGKFLFSASELRSPTVFVFYRGGWSAPCRRYLRKLLETHANLHTLGYEVVFMSADSPASLRADAEMAKLPYTLLSDHRMQAARAFGVAERLGEKTLARFKHFGVDLEQISGQAHHELAIPSAFIVDRSGLVRFAQYHADPNVRVEPRDLIAAASTILRSASSRPRRADVE